MNFLLQPWQLFLVALAGWVNRSQQQAIEYLRTENQILKEKLGKRRILLNDDQRRRLAVKGKTLGRKALAEIATLFTPDTILRWHRQLIARKWDYSDQRSPTGRPRVRQEIVSLALRLARENPTWGCDRIQGALANIGYFISDTTVANILKAHGLEPAPDRKRQTTWKTFLKSHWDVLAAADFTTVEVWTHSGLVTFYLFFVIQLKTRRVELAGVTTSPDSAWIQQIARNLTNADEGFLHGTRYLLLDRDGKYSQEFRDIVESSGTTIVKLPPRSPNLNAFVERFMRTVKDELLDRMIFFGESSLRRALSQFLAHYHEERNHQGLNNQLIQPGAEVGSSTGPIHCRQRLGGLLRYYYRNAA